MQLISTDHDVVERFHAIVGVGFVSGPTRRGDYKPFWTWRTNARGDVIALLRAFWPWLGRRRQAKAYEVISLTGWAIVAGEARFRRTKAYRMFGKRYQDLTLDERRDYNRRVATAA